MAYATAADIASEFKNLSYSGAGASVSEDEVTEFISQEEAVINATISNRYEVPVTDSESVKILKSISIAYSAYRVAKILNLKKEVPIPEKFVPQQLNEGAAFIKAKQQLMSIRNGKLILKDATALSLTQGVKSYNAENNICPKWKRDTPQW